MTATANTDLRALNHCDISQSLSIKQQNLDFLRVEQQADTVMPTAPLTQTLPVSSIQHSLDPIVRMLPPNLPVPQHIKTLGMDKSAKRSRRRRPSELFNKHFSFTVSSTRQTSPPVSPKSTPAGKWKIEHGVARVNEEKKRQRTNPRERKLPYSNAHHETLDASPSATSKPIAIPKPRPPPMDPHPGNLVDFSSSPYIATSSLPSTLDYHTFLLQTHTLTPRHGPNAIYNPIPVHESTPIPVAPHRRRSSFSSTILPSLAATFRAANPVVSRRTSHRRMKTVQDNVNGVWDANLLPPPPQALVPHSLLAPSLSSSPSSSPSSNLRRSSVQQDTPSSITILDSSRSTSETSEMSEASVASAEAVLRDIRRSMEARRLEEKRTQRWSTIFMDECAKDFLGDAPI